MILAIEGCTCAGKTTLMKRLCSVNDGVEEAPEHTPAPVVEGEDMLDRQQRVFSDFLQRYCELKASDKVYLADYTPLGCIAFSLALFKLYGDDRYMRQAMDFANECKSAKVHCYQYLSADPATIIERLKTRARNTDSAWSDRFIAYLCQAYDEVFEDDIFNLNPVSVFEE